VDSNLTQTPGATEADGTHRLGHHVHLLEVHQAVQTGLVALVGEGHVLEQQRHERDQRRLQLAHEHAVRPVVAAGVDQGLELLEDLPELRWDLLPGLLQPGHRHVREAHYHGEEGV